MTDAKAWARRKRCIVVTVSLALWVTTIEQSRAEFAYGLGYAAEHSSNIGRTPSNERSDWTHSLLAGAAYRDTGPELAVNLSAQAQLNHYQDDSFDDTAPYFVDASTLWTIAPERFTWALDDHLTQTQRNLLAPTTPDNRVNTNVFETGPDVYFPLAPANVMNIGARYGYLSFQGADDDNNRNTGHVRWLYGVSAMTTWSLNYEVAAVNYAHDSAVKIDYTHADTFARAEYRPSHSRIAADLGYTTIRRDHGQGGEGVLARLQWLRELTSQSTFSLVAAREYGDAGTALLAGAAIPSLSGGAAATTQVASADVFYSRRIEAAYANNGSAWGGNLVMFYRDFDYQITSQDRREHGGHADVSFNPAGLLTTMIYSDLQETEFLNIARTDDDLTIGVRTRYHLSRSLGLVLDANQVRRSSTDPGAEYVDRRVLLGIYYSSGPLYVPARR